jgi:hypothetical protein
VLTDRSREARIREVAGDRSEAFAVARLAGEGLEVAYTPVAPDVDAAHEHVRVLRARMAAPITERRVLALRTDLTRSPRTRKFIAAVSAKAEHRTGIGRDGGRAEAQLLQGAWASVPE